MEDNESSPYFMAMDVSEQKEEQQKNKELLQHQTEKEAELAKKLS